MGKRIAAAALMLASALVAFAGGSPESSTYTPVNGLENWDTSVDLNGKKEGKYNLIVRATDEAGNVRYAGPFNIVVDPNSDLPLAHISYPTPGARVSSSLNVVGTCIDDDGVQQVMVSLDGAEAQQAKGTGFWSMSFDVQQIDDGVHILSARGVDINGKVGPAQNVTFNVDKNPPSTRILSHASGSLVSGQVTFTGEVQDANGVESLQMSTDGAKSYRAVPLSLDKTRRTGTFRLGIDTRKTPDGPQIIWFRATDRMGSVGLYTFLYFVNNEAPSLEILSPSDKAVVHGKLIIAGKASDKIGLKSLSWDMGGDGKGTIDLVPGNPFWTQPLDLSARKAGTVQITYTLENLTGIRQTRKVTLRVDPEAGRPRITVASPSRGARFFGPVAVYGFASDDTAVDHVEYSLDGAAWTKVPARTGFSFQLSDVAAGSHKLSLKAVDVDGMPSTVAEAPFTETSAPAVITVSGFQAAAGILPFAPGMLWAGDKDAKVTGSIVVSGPSVKAEYSLPGASGRSLSLKQGSKPAEKLFEVSLPKSLTAGKIDLSIKATDGLGVTSEYRTFLFKGSVSGGPGIVLVDSRITPEGAIALNDQPLVGYLIGGAVQSATFDPPTQLLQVQTDGQLFRVTAAASGVTEPTRVQITSSDGSAYSTDPLRFITDRDPPQLSVDRPSAGDWTVGSVDLAGSARDVGGLAQVAYAVDSGDPQPLTVAAGDSGGSFHDTVSLASVEDGDHLILVSATDKAGNVTRLAIPFRKDTTPPTLTLVAPRAQDPVNGTLSLVGAVEDEGQVALVELSQDGKTFQQVGRERQFKVDVNLSALGDKANELQFRCTDAAGNVAVVRPQLTLDLAADVPVCQIQLPAPGQVMRSDFELSGMAFDDDGVASILYRIDGGPFVTLPGGNSYRAQISLADVTDGPHTVDVKAVDIGGLESPLVSSQFIVSKSDPVSTLDSPDITAHLRGEIELKGSSHDPNGIATVEISLDNGQSFLQVDGKESWRYRLNTGMLSDGTHEVMVRAVDTTGAVGLFATTINVDNTPPTLVVDSPKDGDVYTQNLTLNGRTFDNLGPASLAVTMAPLDGPAKDGPKVLEAKLTAGGILRQEVDLKDVPPGRYNIQLQASDQAGNRTVVSRNVTRQASQEAESVVLYFPTGGERVSGPFTVSGRVFSRATTAEVTARVLVDGQLLDQVPLQERGTFHLEVVEGALSESSHTITVEAQLPGGDRLLSDTRLIRYETSGPWVKITAPTPGAYITSRPYLKGEAGWLEATTTPDAGATPGASATAPSPSSGSAGKPKVDPGHALKVVEVSMDNGSSFARAEGTASWRFRLETQDMTNGELRLLVRSTYANGDTAVTRTILTVDTRPPQVTLLQPSEGERFNENVELVGTASDESGLKDVGVSFRTGDKANYEVPSFIQGLYLDTHLLGATYWDAGMGLTFFSDAVKLQAQVGMSPPGRFSGLVIGGKLLANVATLPFSYLFGPDWSFFSMSLAVGADFSYFTMSGDTVSLTDTGAMLAGIVAQLEFAKFRIPGWTFANTYSLYTELQVWFISSDVQATTVPRLSFGVRVGLL
ncbi:MAG TPA: Ig-like domain-containing protein [Spirochaetia bacterium]|nr:Ig-like domain-containing protein [Spirochaetia bacterium]